MYRMRLASSEANNISVKFLLRWSKPAVIAKIVRLNVVLLANPKMGVIVRRAHVTQLKAYLYPVCMTHTYVICIFYGYNYMQLEVIIFENKCPLINKISHSHIMVGKNYKNTKLKIQKG